jgi:hypothetical protein
MELTTMHDVEHLPMSQIGGGLSSSCEESKGFASRSKLGGSIIFPNAISTSSYMGYSTSMMSSTFII